MDARLVALSKEMSYALRHGPHKYGLTLDPGGFVELDELLDAINARHPERTPVTREDVEAAMAGADKQRHEIVRNRIRALYGHSTPERIEKAPARPPEVLFHGTTHRALPAILEEGLKPMGRQYVHLSTDTDAAMNVGGRRDAEPVLLRVDAARAYADGIYFYVGNDDIWLSEAIPARYLERV